MSDKKETSVLKKIGVGAVISVLGVGALFGAGFVGHSVFPTVVEKTVEVPMTVNQTVEVPVDNGKLDSVLQYVYDSVGDISDLEVTDLNDDEVAQIADRIVFINEVKSLSVAEVKASLFHELDRNRYESNSSLPSYVEPNAFNEEDMSRLKVIDNDFEDIGVVVSDFEDKDATVTVEGTFEQNDVDYTYKAKLNFKDGEFDEFESITVEEE